MSDVDLISSPEGCTITLHCSRQSTIRLRDVYMAASDATNMCVSHDQRQSRGAMAYFSKGTFIGVVALASYHCFSSY